MNNIPTAAGSIAPNFHEGARSEYLAQYIFSAFGTALLVPRQEDYGIDMHCTLGFKDGKRFFIQNHYLVQIKSSKRRIIFNNKKSIDWLVKQNYPLFYCYVNKKHNSLDLYQSLLLTSCYWKKNISSIEIIPEVNGKSFEPIKSETNIKIALGLPILAIDIDLLKKEETINNIGKVIKSWVLLHQSNIDIVKSGFTMINVPETYETNLIVPFANIWIGDPLPYPFDQKQINDIHDSFFIKLSQLFNLSMVKRNRTHFDSLYNFIMKYINDNKNFPDSWGIRLLSSSILSAGKSFDPNFNLTLNSSRDGNIRIPALSTVSDILAIIKKGV